MVCLLGINAYALDPLFFIPFPNCLTIKGLVTEVNKNTATVLVNKGARSEAQIVLSFTDWDDVVLLPSTAIEAKAVKAVDKNTFKVMRKNVSIAKKFNPLLGSVRRDKTCEK
ncbi:MAG: hypothetical protein R3C42_10050 [Parvularculaceae bacterium]